MDGYGHMHLCAVEELLKFVQFAYGAYGDALGAPCKSPFGCENLYDIEWSVDSECKDKRRGLLFFNHFYFLISRKVCNFVPDLVRRGLSKVST